MADTVESLLSQMLALRDDECTHNFAADCRSFPPHEQLPMALIYLASVRDFMAWKTRALAGVSKCVSPNEEDDE